MSAPIYVCWHATSPSYAPHRGCANIYRRADCTAVGEFTVARALISAEMSFLCSSAKLCCGVLIAAPATDPRVFILMSGLEEASELKLPRTLSSPSPSSLIVATLSNPTGFNGSVLDSSSLLELVDVIFSDILSAGCDPPCPLSQTPSV